MATHLREVFLNTFLPVCLFLPYFRSLADLDQDLQSIMGGKSKSALKDTAQSTNNLPTPPKEGPGSLSQMNLQQAPQQHPQLQPQQQPQPLPQVQQQQQQPQLQPQQQLQQPLQQQPALPQEQAVPQSQPSGKVEGDAAARFSVKKVTSATESETGNERPTELPIEEGDAGNFI